MQDPKALLEEYKELGQWYSGKVQPFYPFDIKSPAPPGWNELNQEFTERLDFLYQKYDIPKDKYEELSMYLSSFWNKPIEQLVDFLNERIFL